MVIKLTCPSQDETQYFAFGHDVAESQYNHELKESTAKDPVLAMMLCGVGDARHLYHTIADYFGTREGSQKLHITILDHKPAVMARNMIFFSLLHQISINKASGDTVSLSLSYLYCAQIVPPFAWEKLQETISGLVSQLEDGQQPVPFVSLSVSQMDMIVRVLKGWQSGPATSYETGRIRRVIPDHFDGVIPSMNRRSFPECVADHEAFDDFFVMFPPEAALSRFEPELSALVTNYKNGIGGARKLVGNYIDKHWKVNATLIDVEWQARWEPEDLPDMALHPCTIVQAVTMNALELEAPEGESTYCILNHLAEFFERVRLSCFLLGDRLTVEVIIGDMADAMERLRYGVLDRFTRGKVVEEPEPPITTSWPQTYHIVHVSNIP